MKTRHVNTWLMGSLAGAVMLLGAGTAQAVDFKFGEIDAKLDTTVSVGVGIRTSGIDCSKIALDNGGCTTTGAKSARTLGATGSGYSFGVNNDDGNINNGRWRPYSTIAKVTSELQLDWQNYGAFIRGKAFYDYWGAHQVGEHSSGYGTRPLNDAARGNGITDNNNGAGHGIKLLDAFVYGNFTVGGQALNVRLGNQVVNWGESLILQGGINSFLPIDVAAIRTPGSQLKEAYQPVPMIYAQLGLPGNFGIEAFYEFAWTRTRLDSCGTFFSGSDAYCEGGAYVMNAYEYNHSVAALGGIPSQSYQGVFVPRIASEYARNSGQWGVKGSYYADWLNDGTDLGVYYTNFHANLPIGTFTAAGVPGMNGADFCAGAAAGASLDPATTPVEKCLGPLAGAVLIGGAHYGKIRTLAQYPEDIHMFGASFNTTLADLLGGTALSGELTYSPNMPFQVADTTINANSLALSLSEQLAAYIAANPTNSIAQAQADLHGGTPTTVLTNGRPLTAAGDVIPGYDRHRVMTGQIYTISTLTTSNPVTEFLGADLMPLIANVGFQYLNGTHKNLAVPMSGAYSNNAIVDYMLGSGACPGGPATNALNLSTASCPDAQYATTFSWGYRLVAIANYNNAFNTAWTVSPSIQWAHDVSGYSAGPTGPGFIEGRKAVTLGVSGSLQNTWIVSANWTSSFGNKFQDMMHDKDFAQFNVSYAF
ncbi:MAG: DUF1302 domain-containing protein [Parvibaculum sedimenti]|uniref:DUF1302 domain-containing protein n=1 Tax=Parvibaculum sedimenti TaxID=2608632 RepID=UPI003BB6A9F0